MIGQNQTDLIGWLASVGPPQQECAGVDAHLQHKQMNERDIEFMNE
jgi:hypothetical protein